MPNTKNNSPYKAILQWGGGSSGDQHVSANLPESWSFGFASQWDAPWAEGLISNDTLKTALHAGGMATTSQVLTSQVWQSSNPVEISIPFIFVAKTDAYTDVMLPCHKLAGLTLPTKASSSSFMLQAPGPAVGVKIAGFESTLNYEGGEHITLCIGTNIIFTSVVVTSVNVEFDTMLDVNGYPIKAKADVTVLTHQTPIRGTADFNGIFGVKALGPGH